MKPIYNGECLENGKCKCYAGFTGDDCSKKLCLNGCNDNGVCDFAKGKL